MTFSRRRNALAGIALTAAVFGAMAWGAQAGEQGIMDGRGRTAQPHAVPVSIAAERTRTDTRPTEPVVSVAISVLDLDALSASAFGDQDESAR